ncbi:MAG: hypothetical protein QG657_2030 [Acidobacteriota bacterium]|nr:hypothetical protein [Acidobacteriota bacterium]
MKKIYLATFVFMFLLVSFWVTAEETRNNPVAVSPGSETEVVTVWQNCPTFSWSAVDQAASYQLAIFESPDGKIAPYENMVIMATPVVSKQIAGPALSWTLPSGEKLKTGSQYAWYVQALDANGNALGSWSSGRIFQVEQEVRFAGVAEKLESILKSYGVKDDTITNVLDDMKSEVQEVVVNNTPGISGVKGTENSSNTFYGYYAGASTTGTQNAFFGAYAGNDNTTGYYNTFLGDRAGQYNTSGVENTFVGMYAGRNNDDAHYNTFVGTGAGYTNANGTRNSFFGYRAGYYTTGSYNTFLGYYAGRNNTASYNTFLGDSAGYSNTSAECNTFLGYYAGRLNTTGNHNTFLGYDAGHLNTTGYNNTIIGDSAGDTNSTGYNNTALGTSAGYTNSTGTGNIFLGYNAGYYETGSNKLYIENSNSASPLIYGEFNNNIVTVNGKLGVGTSTPDYPMELETTGENAAFVTTRTDGAKNFMSATDSYAQFGAASNHPVRIMVNSTWKMMVNTDGSLSMYNGASCTTGGVWTDASSRALKENIENLSTGEAMETLTKLNPVKYNYKVDKTDKHVGFIAEDVPDLVAASDRKGLSPMDVTAVLTKVVQELQKENQEQKNLNQEYRKIISELQERITKLEKN